MYPFFRRVDASREAALDMRSTPSLESFSAVGDTGAFGIGRDAATDGFAEKPKSSCAKEFLCNLVRGPELNSPRSGNILNHKQHRYVSSPSQTDPPSLLG
jgi:hypothetical protein